MTIQNHAYRSERWGPYAAVLFDMDGVLVDTAAGIADFWQDIAQRYGIRLSEDEIAGNVQGRPTGETLDALFPWLDEAERDAVFALTREYELGDRYTAIPGALELLRSLRTLGIPTALVTSGDQTKVDVVVSQLDLDDLMRVRVTSDDVSAGKPDPECYLLAAQRLAVPIGDCVVFEDAVSGVRAANEAGAACIGVGRAREAVESLLGEGALAIVPDLAAVSVDAVPGSHRAFFEVPVAAEEFEDTAAEPLGA